MMKSACKWLSLVLAMASVGAAAQTVTGSGTTNTVPVFTGTSTVGNSPISVSGSNVGIGTTYPSFPLEIHQGGADNSTVTDLFVGSDHGTNRGVAISFGRSGSDPTGNYSARIVGTANAPADYGSTLQLQTHATSNGNNWNTGIFMDHSGNVGIGTTSPNVLLEVNGPNDTRQTSVLRLNGGGDCNGCGGAI